MAEFFPNATMGGNARSAPLFFMKYPISDANSFSLTPNHPVLCIKREWLKEVKRSSHKCDWLRINKEELVKTLGQDKIKSKLIFATCSSVDETSFNEVLKREETQEALRQERTTQEIKIVEQILTEIAKNGIVAYGLAQVSDAVEAGAVRILAITDGMIKDAREQDKYFVIDKILRKTDNAKGEIKIVHSENSAGKKLDGIGGLAAILRYKI